VLAALAGVLGAGLLVLVFLAWQRFESRGTTFTALGYQVVSDTAVQVRFSVPLTPGTTVSCVVRARDAAGAEVGRSDVRVGPQRTSPVLVTHLVSTVRRAAMGEVTHCSP
jgi:hypothetical protein